MRDLQTSELCASTATGHSSAIAAIHIVPHLVRGLTWMNTGRMKRMAKKRKEPMTAEDRIRAQRTHVKKLTNMLKNIKEIRRTGGYCEQELGEVAHKLRVIREIYKEKIILELQREIRIKEKSA